jgi:hypothetical protein
VNSKVHIYRFQIGYVKSILWLKDFSITDENRNL